VLDGSHHFVFLIEDVPVRFYRGAADDAPSAPSSGRRWRRSSWASPSASRRPRAGVPLGVETGPGGAAERVVFLALRGEEGLTECFWPVPLDEAEPAAMPWQGHQLALPGHNASAVSQDPPRLRAGLGSRRLRGHAVQDRHADDDVPTSLN
jgi:hypothetical protein